MRAAVVSLTLAALAATSSGAFTVKKTNAAPRKLAFNAGACQTAVQAFGQCWHGSYADDAARDAACCPSIDALMSSCGSDLYDSFTNIMGVSAGVDTGSFLAYLADFRGFMDGVGSCARVGQTMDACNSAIAATSTACTGSPIADVPTCCNKIHDEITQCLGIDGTDFFDSMAPLAQSSGCAPFSAGICTNAAKLLSKCVSASSNPSSDCCNTVNWQQMDCMNVDVSVYGAFMPDADTTSALSTACNNHNGGGGGNDGGNMCDGSRLAPGFAWYDDSNGGFVITNNAALKTGDALFTDNNGAWYRVDFGVAPGAAALSRQPDQCFSGNNNNNNGGGRRM